MREMERQEKLISLEELCDLLQVRKSYIYRLTSQNEIPYYKIGGLRFKFSEVTYWLESKKIKVQRPRTVHSLFN